MNDGLRFQDTRHLDILCTLLRSSMPGCCREKKTRDAGKRTIEEFSWTGEEWPHSEAVAEQEEFLHLTLLLQLHMYLLLRWHVVPKQGKGAAQREYYSAQHTGEPFLRSVVLVSAFRHPFRSACPPSRAFAFHCLRLANIQSDHLSFPFTPPTFHPLL